MTKNPSSDATLPKGIHRSWKLPDKSLGDLWDSIVMDEAIKKQLLSQAIVNFTVRPTVERTPATPISLPPKKTCPVLVTPMRILLRQRRGDAGVGAQELLHAGAELRGVPP